MRRGCSMTTEREGRSHAYTDWLTGCCYVERIVEFGGFWSVLTPLSSPLPSPCPPSTWRCPALPPTPPPHSLAAKGLLRGVDHVEEAVLVSLLLVDLRDGRGHRHHAVLVDQQEEGLRGVQLQPASVGWGGLRCYFLKHHVFCKWQLASIVLDIHPSLVEFHSFTLYCLTLLLFFLRKQSEL